MVGLMSVTGTPLAEQSVDAKYIPQNIVCTFCKSDPPTVAVDSAHFNYHTLDNRFQPFGKILRSDGYVVIANEKAFKKDSLKHIDILVIANAVNERNKENWDLPNYSAFTREEIEALYEWVKNGGSLFLIADHLPWPAAASELASIFGFSFFNGYAEIVDESKQFFSVSDGSLLDHSVLKLQSHSKITKVRGFLGQSFLIPPDAMPILKFKKPTISWMPSESWNIEDTTPNFDATGYYQGALMKFGKGRLAIFGEAGMFTAQIVNDNDGEEPWKLGLNADDANQNEQFLLSIMQWLAGKL